MGFEDGEKLALSKFRWYPFETRCRPPAKLICHPVSPNVDLMFDACVNLGAYRAPRLGVSPRPWTQPWSLFACLISPSVTKAGAARARGESGRQGAAMGCISLRGSGVSVLTEE
ncbi:MAG: hypothetical protein OEU98_07920, partial [Actinomycetota bacterium]|nr:hypothetical protein [Actinomycetota bacterium]